MESLEALYSVSGKSINAMNVGSVHGRLLILLLFISIVGASQSSDALSDGTSRSIGTKSFEHIYSVDSVADLKASDGITDTVRLKQVGERYFVATRSGQIYSFNISEHQIVDLVLLLDIGDIVQFGLKMTQDGLLDFQFDKDFDNNSILYLSYTSKTNSRTAGTPSYSCNELLSDLEQLSWENFYSPASIRTFIENKIIVSEDTREIKAAVLSVLKNEFVIHRIQGVC